MIMSSTKVEGSDFIPLKTWHFSWQGNISVCLTNKVRTGKHGSVPILCSSLSLHVQRFTMVAYSVSVTSNVVTMRSLLLCNARLVTGFHPQGGITTMEQPHPRLLPHRIHFEGYGQCKEQCGQPAWEPWRSLPSPPGKPGDIPAAFRRQL